jgi:hypothetical protein
MCAVKGKLITPLTLNLGTSWKWVVTFTHRPFYPRGKSPRCPINKRLGGSQSRFGRCGEYVHFLRWRESNCDFSDVYLVLLKTSAGCHYLRCLFWRPKTFIILYRWWIHGFRMILRVNTSLKQRQSISLWNIAVAHSLRRLDNGNLNYT